MATKKYKPHMMYCKDGTEKKAMTYKEHLALKKKGCEHSPMKMDPYKGKEPNKKQPPKDRKMGKPKQDRKLPEKRKRGTRDKDGNIIGGIKS